MQAFDARPSRPTNPWCDEVQLRLAQLNVRRLRPSLPEDLGMEDVVADAELRIIEKHWIDAERRAAAIELDDTPTTARAIVTVVEAHVRGASLSFDSLRAWLAREGASHDARWIVGQELGIASSTAGFEAVAQLGLPRAVQHAFVAQRERALRSDLPIVRLAHALDVADEAPLVAEALALANLEVGLACNRRFAFHAVGASLARTLACDDLTSHLVRVLRRAGRTLPTIIFDVADERPAWACATLAALLHDHPESARAVVEGSVLRLRAGARRFRRYERWLRSLRT